MIPARKPPGAADPLLTAKEVAAQLKVSLTWVTVHANGKYRPFLPSIKMGRSLRFRQSAIDDFIDKCNRQMAAGLPLH